MSTIPVVGIRKLNELSRKIFLKLPQTANIMVSPVSILPVLLMLALGADGETKRAILDGIGITEEEIPTVFDLIGSLKAKSVNNLFVSDTLTLRRQFLKEVNDLAKALPELVDFKSSSAKERIDTWVQENTNNKINKLFDNLDPNTMLVLANAIHFKDGWEQEFEESNTTSKPFLDTEKGSISMVPTMFIEGEFGYGHNHANNIEVVDLPYANSKTKMRVIKTLVDDPAYAFEESQKLSYLYQMNGEIEIPKFKSEYSTSLNGMLEDLGMGVIFTDQADFSKMSEEPLKVGSSIHRTFIEVNEEGSEAAAVTGMGMVRCAAVFMEPTASFKFKADRSFYYEIIDQLTGLVIFIGRVVRP